MRQILRHNQSVIPNETLPRRCDPFLAVRSEREVRDAGVSAIERPFGFAVADDEAARWHFILVILLLLLCWFRCRAGLGWVGICTEYKASARILVSAERGSNTSLVGALVFRPVRVMESGSVWFYPRKKI